MSDLRVIPSHIYQCGPMSRRLRHAQLAAWLNLGVNVHRGLHDTFLRSYWTRSWALDGELTAMAGSVGSMLSPYAFVWLALSERIVSYPKLLVREARKGLDELMGDKIELRTTCLVGDDAALRLAVFLGFRVEGRERAFSRHGRRMMLSYVHEAPDYQSVSEQKLSIKMTYDGVQA